MPKLTQFLPMLKEYCEHMGYFSDLLIPRKGEELGIQLKNYDLPIISSFHDHQVYLFIYFEFEGSTPRNVSNSFYVSRLITAR